MITRFFLYCAAGLLVLGANFPCLTHAAPTADSPGSTWRSPENQVFQFMQGEGNATAYLWIPEKCQRLRGLLILCPTVPEELLVGHPAIRQACADNDLGIIWSVHSFWYWSPKPQIDGLQKLLDGLAVKSGYSEVATVPWLPMGESAHLNMVKALVDTLPDRCIAAVCIKNANYPQNRTVPILLTEGTAQEWSQPAGDIRRTWNNPTGSYNVLCGLRRDSSWPMSILIEPGTGHFNCSERMAQYFGRYIDRAAKARLSDDGSPTLKPVKLDSGFLAQLPVPTHENQPVTPYSSASDSARPWFFDEAGAREAQAMAHVEWDAQTQLPSVAAVSSCSLSPWSNNGVNQLDVSTSSTFTLAPVFLDAIPAGFVGAGAPLAKSPVTPVIEWLCGPIAPVGNGTFRISLDRTWKMGGIPCVLVRADAAPGIRYSNQPITINLRENKAGAKQTLAFNKLADVKAGTASVPVAATSSAGLRVDFFVDSGPAIIKDGRLVFTPIPPRSHFPVEVTVVAWQWGQATDPKVQTADLVKQKFQILDR